MEIAKKFLDEGKPADAFERLKKILREENFSEEWKLHELIGACFHDLADAEGAAQAYLNAAKADKILRSQREHFSNYLFALHYLPQVDENILFDTAKIYNSLYRDAEILPQKNFLNKKIHVAYIAPHFLDSSSARFYESLLTEFDSEKFFVTAWSLSSREDNFTKKIRLSVNQYFDISEISFEEAARKIFDNGADILFDLGGHSDGGMTLQIAAYRPAKVQICGIGYFDTTGTNFIDYFLTDNFLLGGNENFFSEKIFAVENAFAFKPNEKMIHAKKNLQRTPHKNFVFGCLNNFMKISDDYLNCVKKILEQVPQSKIIFRDTTPLESRKIELTKKIAEKNIPAERTEIFCGEDNFFNDYAKIDLILDTFPYTGGMMTALALYFGVPVLNLCGKIHHSRFGAEMIRLAEQEDFIVRDSEKYIAKAVEISESPRKVFSADRLLDTKNFVANVEKFFSAVAK